MRPILLPTLLLLSAAALAAPTPLRSRSVPDVKEVIRNPSPIDERVSASGPEFDFELNHETTTTKFDIGETLEVLGFKEGGRK